MDGWIDRVSSLHLGAKIPFLLQPLPTFRNSSLAWNVLMLLQICSRYLLLCNKPHQTSWLKVTLLILLTNLRFGQDLLRMTVLFPQNAIWGTLGLVDPLSRWLIPWVGADYWLLTQLGNRAGGCKPLQQDAWASSRDACIFSNHGSWFLEQGVLRDEK